MRDALVVMLLAALVLVPAHAFADEPADRLMQRYRAAHESGDREALRALVYWGGATDRTRENIEDRLFRQLDKAIKTIEFRPLSGDEDFESSGYRPSLKPVGWLILDFVPAFENSTDFLGIFFVVGELDGEYVIAVSEKTE